MMRLLDEAIRKRAEEQAREAAIRRAYCACGCGAWWFAPKSRGRPRVYLDDFHRRWATAPRIRRREARRQAADPDRRHERGRAKMD